MVTFSTCGSSGLACTCAMKSLKATGRGFVAIGLKELPDRQEHQDQQDPEQQRLVRLLHENLIVRERLRVSTEESMPP